MQGHLIVEFGFPDTCKEVTPNDIELIREDPKTSRLKPKVISHETWNKHPTVLRFA